MNTLNDLLKISDTFYLACKHYVNKILLLYLSDVLGDQNYIQYYDELSFKSENYDLNGYSLIMVPLRLYNSGRCVSHSQFIISYLEYYNLIVV